MEHRVQSDLDRADFLSPVKSHKVHPNPAEAATEAPGHMLGGAFRAPVDGTSGDLGFCAGAIFVDAENAQAYTNKGTSASPTWEAITSA